MSAASTGATQQQKWLRLEHRAVVPCSFLSIKTKQGDLFLQATLMVVSSEMRLQCHPQTSGNTPCLPSAL